MYTGLTPLDVSFPCLLDLESFDLESYAASFFCLVTGPSSLAGLSDNPGKYSSACVVVSMRMVSIVFECLVPR